MDSHQIVNKNSGVGSNVGVVEGFLKFRIRFEVARLKCNKYSEQEMKRERVVFMFKNGQQLT